MKIWITGSAGFLGKRLAQTFTAQGATVVGLSRRDSEHAAESIAVDLSNEKSIEVVRQTAKSNGAPDVVIHAASKQPAADGSFRDFVRANVLTTVHLLEGLSETPPAQIIYTSTLSVYPPRVTLPVTENAPPVAQQHYSATKRWAEELVQRWNHSRATVLRLPSIYGKGQADSFLDGLARLALRGEPIELFSSGELIREALHVSDIVTAIQRCIEQRPTSQFSLMNIGNGRPITTMEYAQTLVDELNSSSELVKSDQKASQHSMWADISLAQRTIGFTPTELRESIKTYVDELRA